MQFCYCKGALQHGRTRTLTDMALTENIGESQSRACQTFKKDTQVISALVSSHTPIVDVAYKRKDSRAYPREEVDATYSRPNSVVLVFPSDI